MASPKKRNKTHRPRTVHIPMLADMRNTIATRMHIAVAELQRAPSVDSANEVAKQLAIMTAAVDYQSPVRISDRLDPECIAICCALKAMENIEQRKEVYGKVGISGDEMVALKKAAARFDEVLKRIPMNVYEASRIFVEQALDPHYK